MSENLESEQHARLWEHRLHVENLFYSRLNFVLIFESVLLGIVGALYSKNGPPIFVLKVISFLGFIITVTWFIAQVRYKQTVDVLFERAKECLPEYRETMEKIKKREGGFFHVLPAQWLE